MTRSRARVTRERSTGHRSAGPRGPYAPQYADPVVRPKGLKPPVYQSIEEVPAHIRERGLNKLKWIRRFLNEGCPRGQMMEYAEAYATSQGIPEEEIPPYSTMNGWVQRHRHFGLLGHMDAIPEPEPRVMDETKQEVLKILRFGGMKTPAAALKALADLAGDSDEIPSYSTVWRTIRKIERENPHLRVLVDEGEAGFQNKLRLALAGARYPAGVVVSADSTVYDMVVRIPDPEAPDGWKGVRVVLTVVEDLGSRALLTYNLSLKALDSGIMLSTFRRAINQEANYPGLISLPTFPRKVFVDKGAENHGAFQEQLDEWGVDIEYGHPNEPEKNARVERLIQTITQEVAMPSLGYSKCHKTFDHWAKPDQGRRRRMADLKYEAVKLEVPVMSLPTLAELDRQILAWAIQYNQRPHPGLPVDEEFSRLCAIVQDLEARLEACDE